MTQKKFTFGRAVIYFILVLLCATIVVAFWHLLNLSLSPSHIATRGGLLLYPREATLDNYARVIGNRYIWLGYKNTLIRTCVGTILQLFFTVMGAYVLSKRKHHFARGSHLAQSLVPAQLLIALGVYSAAESHVHPKPTPLIKHTFLANLYNMHKDALCHSIYINRRC